MLDVISRGAQGHGPVHLLLTFAAELGFAWDGDERGWVRVSVPPLRMMTGPIQHFRSAILDAWRFLVFSRLPERKGFGGGEFADFQGSLQLLTSSHLRERDKMLLRAILCGCVWNGVLLGKAKKEDVRCRFCGKRDGDGYLFWDCPFLPLQHVRDLPEFAFLLSLDRSKWPRCWLWHGWLPGLNGISTKDPWATSFGDLASFPLEQCLGAYLVGFDDCWTPPEYWDADDVALEMTDHPNVWTDRSREDFSSVGGFEVAGAGVYLPASELAFEGSVGERQKSMVTLAWSVAVLFSLFLGLCRLFNVLNFGVLFLPCRRTGLVILVLTTFMLLKVLVACWIMVAWVNLCLWLKIVI